MRIQTSYSRVIFLLLIIMVAMVLATRPLPSIFDNNDTGRYVETFHKTCDKPVSFDWTSRITWETYNLLTTPVCLVESDALYLILFALPVPLAFFVFGFWRQGSFMIACAILFSFVGFEFMTNALRQSVSLFFLLGAFAYIGRPYYQILMIVPAFLLHDFTISFIPLLILLSYFNNHSRRLSSGLVYASLGIVLGTMALFSLNSVYLGGQGDIVDLFDIFQRKYESEQSVWFQLFVALPAIWIFFARWANDKEGVSFEERITIIYSAVVFFITVLWFPFIPYRFAMGATGIQLFLAMRNNKSVFRVPMWIFFGLATHLLIYTAFSKNVILILFGYHV